MSGEPVDALSSIQSADQAISDKELRKVQSVLDNREFQKTVLAHRMFDRQRHGWEIYKSFPDFSPPGSVLGELKVQGKGVHFLLSAQELEIVKEQLTKGQNCVRSAWLFAGIEHTDGNITFVGGHPIHLVKTAEEIEEIMESDEVLKTTFQDPGIIYQTGKFIKGMFIKMGGDYFGNFVLQLDGGKSRNLWDESIDKKALMARMLQNLTDPQKPEPWINFARLVGVREPLLLVSSAEFKIEYIAKLNEYVK